MIFFALALNYYAKADIKVFYSCQALLDLLIFWEKLNKIAEKKKLKRKSNIRRTSNTTDKS